MSFFCTIQLHSLKTPPIYRKPYKTIKKITTSLQNKLLSNDQAPNEKFSCRKRMSLFTSHNKRGSMTIEAALILPIFFFTMISVIYIGESMRFFGNIQAVLHQNAKELSGYAYVYKKVNDGDSSLAGKIGSIGFSQLYVKNKVMQELGYGTIENAPIRDGKRGLNFLYSKIMEDEMIDLVVTSHVKTPFDVIGINDFVIVNRARMRAWTGYDNTKKNAADSEEEIVFITKNGEVYHRSRNCKHLNISIRQVEKSKLKNRRNDSGGKYYPCEYCGGKKAGNMIYITDSGDRFHTTVTCSGLKRDILAVPISKAGGRKPCSNCGN